MQHQTKKQTEKIALPFVGSRPGSGARYTPIYSAMVQLEVGESLVFDMVSWKLKSSPKNYISTFKRHGRKYSLKTTLDGQKLIVREK